MRSQALKEMTGIENGTRIFNHGNDMSPALVNLYHEKLQGELVAVISAHQWWTEDLRQVSDVYDRSNYPVVGSIFVGLGGLYDAIHGHIGIVISIDSVEGTMFTIEQNGGRFRYVGVYQRDISDGILGYLIPKGTEND